MDRDGTTDIQEADVSAQADAPPLADSSAEIEARREQRRKEAARRRRRRRWLIAVAAVLVLLSPGFYSYTDWMLQPTSMSTGVRSVEWVRSQPAGNWLVDHLEHIYYSWRAPKKGGPQLTVLPAVGTPNRTGPKRDEKAPAQAVVLPPRVKSIFAHALPGEGVWKPSGPQIEGGPPVLVTTFRTDLEYPRTLAYAAWFDHTRTAIGYYPGRYEPPHAAVRGPMMVPFGQRWRLLATFNAGFTYTYGWNGSTDNGQVNEPLTEGNATLLGYKDGHVAIVKWTGGENAGPNVAWSRQSLPPIVWGGKVNPKLDYSLKWGATLGNAVRVWRTGVGIDRNGNLIFVAADAQTVMSLAHVFTRLGAVRAMQFDINPYWHSLITYTHHHGLVPKLIEPQPNHNSGRYLTPDDRDFFAVYRRLPGPVTVPFK